MIRLLSIIIFSLMTFLAFGQEAEDCKTKNGRGIYSILVADVIDQEVSSNKKVKTLRVDTILSYNGIMTLLHSQSGKKLRYLSDDKELAYLFVDENSLNLNNGDKYILYIDSIYDGYAYIPYCSNSKSVYSKYLDIDVEQFSVLSKDGKAIHLSLKINITLDKDFQHQMLKRYDYDIDRNLTKKIYRIIRKEIGSNYRQYWIENFDVLNSRVILLIEDILVLDYAKLTNCSITPVHNTVSNITAE